MTLEFNKVYFHGYGLIPILKLDLITRKIRDSKDIFFEKSKGKIRFDNYGDSCHFLKKQETGTDIWELGTLLFSLLKGSPPYQNRLPNDIHFNCLNKGQF